MMLARLASATLLIALASWLAPACAEDPIAIANLERDTPVDFESELLPVLRQNCIACHNHAGKKGGLVLETPQTIQSGGDSGDVVEPGNGADSYLLQVATRESEPFMPPPDNNVGAKALTPEQLGLLKRWIDEGAKGEVRNRADAVAWQPLPPGVNPIYAVAISPDDEFAVCGRANQIFVYDLPERRLLCRLTDPALVDGTLYAKPGIAQRDLVQSLAFSPDGYTLASGDYRTVRLWRRPTDVQRLQLAADQPITSLATSTDGKQIATGLASGQIQLWNAETGEARHTLNGHSAAVAGLVFSADGARLFSSSEDHTIRGWDAVAGQPLGTIITLAPVAGLALAPDGERLASASADGSVRTWLPPVAPSTSELVSAPAALLAAAATPDALSVALACADGQLLLFDAGKNEVRRTWSPHGAGPISVAISPDGKWLATGGADSQVRVWDIGALFAAAADQPPPAALVGNGPAAVARIAWHPGGDELAVAGADGRVTIWSRAGATAGEVPLKVVRQFAVHGVPLVGIVYAPDGGRIYVAASDGTIAAHQAADGSRLYAVAHGAAVNDLAMSADGQRLASAGHDQHVRQWNSADGAPAPAATIEGFAAPVLAVRYAPAGDRLLASSDAGRVLSVDAASGATEQVLQDQTGSATGLAVCAAAANQVFAVSSDKSVRKLTLAADRRIASHEGGASCVAWFADGKQLVSGGRDGFVLQTDVAKGAEVRKLEMGGPVLDVAARPDGSRIAAVSDNHLLRLWNAADGKLVSEVRGDFKFQRIAAQLSGAVAAAGKRIEETKAVLDAAEKAATEKLAAAQAAESALTMAVAAASEANTKSQQAAEAKAAAEKAAADAAALAKSKADAKAAADKLAQELTDAVALATDAATKAQAATEALAASTSTIVAMASATKAAAEKNAADAAFAEVAAAAEKSAAEATAADQSTQALHQQLAKLVTEKTVALQTAQQQRMAAETAAAEAAAAEKAAAEAKAAAEKTAKEMADAAAAASTAQQAAEKALADAKRFSQLANEAAPIARTTWEVATAELPPLEAREADAKKQAEAHDQPLRSIAFASDGKLLAFAGDDGIVRAYRAEDGAPFETFTAHEAPVAALAFLPTGIVSASSDRSARLWDVYPVWSLAGQLGPPADAPADLGASVLANRVLALAFSPDGKLLATGGGEPSRSGELKIWDLAEKTIVLDLPEAHTDTIFGLEFSPDGKLVATASADKFVRVFEVATGKQVRSFEGHTHHVLGVAWQHDGRLLASAGADRVVKVWNMETGEQQRTIGGFGKEVTSISFVADSSQTLTSAGDSSVRYYETNDGKSPRKFDGASDYVYCARITPDGRYVAAGGQDSVLRVWNGADGKLIVAFEPPQAETPPADAASAEAAQAKSP
ncbi:MAG: c-type cytochrome domain-containing protein [Pirellulales bacterium]